MCTECAVEDHDLHGVKKLEGIIEAEKEELEALIMKVGGNFVLIFSFQFFQQTKTNPTQSQAKQKDHELSGLIKTVIATVDGVRVQGKAALCEVEAVFKKLHRGRRK